MEGPDRTQFNVRSGVGLVSTPAGEIDETSILTAEDLLEIEAIINSRNPLFTTTDRISAIISVYERRIYELFRNDFDEFGRIRDTYGRDSAEAAVAEAALGRVLQNSGIDIRAVAREMAGHISQVNFTGMVTARNNTQPNSLGGQILHNLDRSIGFLGELTNFFNQTRPGAPLDLKARPLHNALVDDGRRGLVLSPHFPGLRSQHWGWSPSSQESLANSQHNFSIWSRQWEPNMPTDFLGNYIFGYFGMHYWQGFSFTQHTPISPLTSNLLSEHGRRSGAQCDAETLMLLGGGGGQLLFDIVDNPRRADEAIRRYINDFNSTYWGDNRGAEDGVGDARMIRDGIDDWRNAHAR